MHISTHGTAFIASFEGYAARPYRDAVGVWTIGYGHTGSDVFKLGTLSKARALELLKHDLERTYEPPVNDLRLPLNQNQFDALVSFVYNLGSGVIGPSSTMGQDLRKHNWSGAAVAFLLYDHAGGKVLAGLLRRRRAERAMFLRGVSRPLSKRQKWQHRLDAIRIQAHKHGWNKALIAEARRLKVAIGRSK